MSDLGSAYLKLVEADQQGQFEEALRSTALSRVPIRRHPLGFFVAKVEDGKGTALRLHLWPKVGSGLQDGFEVHDHLFDLESYVIQGAVQETTYVAEAAHEGPHRIYNVVYESDSSRLSASGTTISLKVTRERTIAAGESYELPAGVLHLLQATMDRSVTLVLTQDRLLAPIAIGPSLGPTHLEACRTEVQLDDRAMTVASCNGISDLFDLIERSN